MSIAYEGPTRFDDEHRPRGKGHDSGEAIRIYARMHEAAQATVADIIAFIEEDKRINGDSRLILFDLIDSLKRGAFVGKAGE